MGLFYLIVVLILAALTFIYFFIIKYKPTHVSITDGNLKLYKQQISDFKKDHSMGYVNVDEFQNEGSLNNDPYIPQPTGIIQRVRLPHE